MSHYSLREHLAHQLRSGYRMLEKAVQGLSEAQAVDGARPDWRRYRWGTGLDGSIAGIVHHAALWKQIFAQGLETGTFPTEADVAPPGTDWAALREWLAAGQSRLERALEPLSEAALGEAREWEGHREPLARLLTYVIEHDAYHAGQVELLRQFRGYPRVED
jgi:DinB family protein